MKKILIKKSLFILTIIACFFSLTLFKTKAALATDISYLCASIGETNDQVGISYHTSNEDSYILYGTQKNGNTISNAVRAVPTSTLWKYDASEKDTADGYGFANRYVCKHTLTNLELGTTYYYQVVSGSSTSEIQSFKTGGDASTAKTLMFLTDIQSSGSGFKNAQTLVDEMLKSSNANPDLLFMTGDQVDRGGIEQQWIDYYRYFTYQKNVLQATVPGNHEYYLSSSGSYISNEVYNNFYNNPLNGPADRIGSSYYSVYGQVLIIMLDIVKTTDYNVAKQQEWFKNVVKNNPTQWIIVGSHPGVYCTGAYESDSQIMRRNWLEVFEECQVDLALNGHEHVYARKNIRFGGQANSDKSGTPDQDFGVTYLAGSAAGLKSYGHLAKNSLLEDYTKYNEDSTDKTYGYYDKYNNNTGCLIKINGDKLTVEQYKASGLMVDSFTLNAKRPAEIEKVSAEDALKSFKVEYDKEIEKAIVSWSETLYGNVDNIYIQGGYKDKDSIVVSSGKLNKRYYNVVDENENWTWHVKLTMNDGTVLEKDLKLILNKDIIEYNIVYDLDGGVNNEANPNTYKPADLPLELKEPTKEGYKFKHWTINGRRGSTIKEGTTEDVNVVAVWEVEQTVEPVTPDNPPKAKKGCKKNTALAFTSALTLCAACLILFRKKH